VRIVRAVVVLAIGLVVAAPALFVVEWLTFAGARFGWVLTTLAFGALGVVVGWLAIASAWPRARQVTCALLVVAGVGVGIFAAHFAPATPGRLRHEIESFVGSGWTLRSDHAYGNAACFDSCTEVERAYVVATDADAVLAELAPVFDRRRCFRPTPTVDAEAWSCDDQPGDIAIRVEVHDDGDATTIRISARATG
jgi:hypothetical protein